MAAQNTNGSNTIQLDHEAGDFISDEALATAVALYPGMLVEKTSTGAVQAHSTAGGWSERTIVQEDALQGKNVTEAYAASGRVFFNRVRRGARSLMILFAGENVAIGAELISDGSGRVIATTGTPEETVAIADEALDLSGSGAVDTLIRVRVI